MNGLTVTLSCSSKTKWTKTWKRLTMMRVEQLWQEISSQSGRPVVFQRFSPYSTPNCGPALKWAFADFDNLTVEADKLTLTPEDLAKVTDLLKLRPIQFCMFLKALVGTEEMLRTMVEAIGVGSKVRMP
jgi:hypothetical protein